MIDTAKEALATAFLGSLRARDWSAMRRCMHPEITWSLPGSAVISGTSAGVDATIEKARRIVSYEVTFTLVHLLEGEHGFTLSLHNTAERGALMLDEYLSTVCAVEGGVIRSITTYLSDVAMMNAFFT